MRFCAISDLHGYLSIFIKPCDYLLIAGDIVSTEVQKDTYRSVDWFKTKFIPGISKLPVEEKVIFIGGNHDKFLEESNIREFLPDNMVYLQDEIYDCKGDIQVCGSPWCKKFMRWSFMRKSQEELKRLWGNIEFTAPKSIFLTHDAPHGTSDVLLQRDCPWAREGEHIGNMALKEVLETLQPDYNIHGHLHSTNHEPELLGKTKVVNVSLVNEFYKVVYKPYYFEL